jgi:hypothetical protein
MPTPTERLNLRKQLADCRVCAWLATLDDKARREWQAAIMNTRFGAQMVADEIMAEVAVTDYAGQSVGEASVQTHRQRGHR